MERYIGLDAHATSCTFAVLSERGRRLDSAVVETNGRALVKFLRGVPGNKHVCLEVYVVRMFRTRGRAC